MKSDQANSGTEGGSGSVSQVMKSSASRALLVTLMPILRQWSYARIRRLERRGNFARLALTRFISASVFLILAVFVAPTVCGGIDLSGEMGRVGYWNRSQVGGDFGGLSMNWANFELGSSFLRFGLNEPVEISDLRSGTEVAYTSRINSFSIAPVRAFFRPLIVTSGTRLFSFGGGYEYTFFKYNYLSGLSKDLALDSGVAHDSYNRGWATESRQYLELNYGFDIGNDGHDRWQIQFAIQAGYESMKGSRDATSRISQNFSFANPGTSKPFVSANIVYGCPYLVLRRNYSSFRPTVLALNYEPKKRALAKAIQTGNCEKLKKIALDRGEDDENRFGAISALSQLGTDSAEHSLKRIALVGELPVATVAVRYLKSDSDLIDLAIKTNSDAILGVAISKLLSDQNVIYEVFHRATSDATRLRMLEHLTNQDLLLQAFEAHPTARAAVLSKINDQKLLHLIFKMYPEFQESAFPRITEQPIIYQVFQESEPFRNPAFSKISDQKLLFQIFKENDVYRDSAFLKIREHDLMLAIANGDAIGDYQARAKQELERDSLVKIRARQVVDSVVASQEKTKAADSMNLNRAHSLHSMHGRRTVIKSNFGVFIGGGGEITIKTIVAANKERIQIELPSSSSGISINGEIEINVVDTVDEEVLEKNVLDVSSWKWNAARKTADILFQNQDNQLILHYYFLADGGLLLQNADDLRLKPIKKRKKNKEPEIPEIIIGDQTWMAKNLATAADSSFCYDIIPENCVKYGRLYDWRTANHVCPEHWKLPSVKDWDNLVASISRGSREDKFTQKYNWDDRGTKRLIMGDDSTGRMLKSKTGWEPDGNGTDDFGFHALPGGVESSNGFVLAGERAFFWTSSEMDSTGAFACALLPTGVLGRSPIQKTNRISVRCIKDQ